VKSYGTDRYDRILSVVFVDGKNVNFEMIKAGLAEVYRGNPARGLDLEPYWKAEAEARKERRHIWSLEDKYVSLMNWRKIE
jgi:micrococcal nuclease